MSRVHRRYVDPVAGPAVTAATDQLRSFLTARLREDLARVWDRQDQPPGGTPRPGAAALVEVIDDLLATLRAGGLPVRRELRILLYGYGGHPDYDTRWSDLLLV